MGADRPSFDGRHAGREAVPLRWGFVPVWAPDLSIGNKMINARAETVFQKNSFRKAIHTKRCLVPVSGFYEWKVYGAGAAGRGKKQAYLIQRKNQRPFVLGGLWEHNEIVPEGPIETFTVLTTHANALMKDLHERMPVIIPDEAIERWLNPATPDIRDLLTPYTADDLEAVPVSDYVNDATHEGPQCIEKMDVSSSTPLLEKTESVPRRKVKSKGVPGQQELFFG